MTTKQAPPVVEPKFVEDYTPPPETPAEREVKEVSEAWSTSAGEVSGSRKPDISHLEDAIAMVGEAPVCLFNVGDMIVIERHATMLPKAPWLDTQAYKVQDIDDDTGVLKLWNPDMLQFAYGNFITGPKRGDVYKLANEAGGMGVGRKKRGRPKKAGSNPAAKPSPTGEKKGRGRPKGAKNRPKDVIKAEKLKLAEERKARASKRKVKRVKK